MTTLNSDFPSPPGSLPESLPMPAEGALHWISEDEVQGFSGGTRVFLTQDAFCRAVEHAASDMENEVGGILAGRRSPLSDDGKWSIVIEKVLPARFTRQGSTFVTFTQDSLVAIINDMDDRFPDLQIVGWYHTHPRLGLFLSHYDTWLHHHFFPEPWQVALVMDPHPSIAGFFVRQVDGSLDPDRHCGFYEVEGRSGISIVHWRNLQSMDASAAQGEISNE